MSLDANTCTIELSTGGFVEVALSPEEVMKLRWSVVGTGKFIELPRLTGAGRRDADYRQAVFVDPLSIVAIHPLDERSIPPRRVYVDRVEAVVS